MATGAIPEAREVSKQKKTNSQFGKTLLSGGDKDSTCDGDKSSFCQLGVQFGYCSVESYRTVCCDTCKESP